MKKKIKLADLKVESFQTSLNEDQKQTAKGGTGTFISDRLNMCISQVLLTCDCTDMVDTDCCNLG